MDLFINFAIGNSCKYAIFAWQQRCVAQSGSALRSGRRGRRFKSSHTDKNTFSI